jgi:hypothetical protein|tara:strand:- start:1220 stop:2446 length:1227 start_codon:yes stop_codon:yes gene_type:complete
MAAPTLRVRFGFVPNVFTLDDLIRGTLSTSNVLGGAVTFTDVTSYVQSVSISRGRSRDLNSFSSGTATINLENSADGRFNPANASGPYYPGIEPLIQVIVDCLVAGESSYTTLYTGFVTDWLTQYPNKTTSKVQVSCSDAFVKLANIEVDSLSVSSTDSGSMVSSILSNAQVSFSGSTSIDTGNSTMQSINKSTNALALIQEIEKSENGAFFVGADGTLNFKNRHASFPTTSTAVFSDDGSDIPYLEVNQPVDDDLIFNVINLTREGGSLQTASDTASQSKYLKRYLERSNLLNASDSDVASAALFLLAKFKDALPRFSSMVLNIDTLSAANQLTVLGLELSAGIKIEITPPGEGSQIARESVVDGISFAISPDDFVVRFNVSDAVNSAFFRLNSATYGQLDDDRLGY